MTRARCRSTASIIFRDDSEKTHVMSLSTLGLSIELTVILRDRFRHGGKGDGAGRGEQKERLSVSDCYIEAMDTGLRHLQ